MSSQGLPPGVRPPGLERIGRYRITEKLGKGGMGVVYGARDETMGREVAVKVMMADFEGEPEIRARFLREAQLSARLAHRNIVTVFDAGEDDGRFFIVMERLRGQTLGDRLKSGALALDHKLDVILQVCEGLAVASAAGVYHRDIKPGNLFLEDDGGVKILDFGIARLASSSMTASGFIVGTPDYMSPEQAMGAHVDARSDIFSVGAVLYLMLSMRKPFVAPNLPAVLHKVIEEAPPPLTAQEALPELARIVMKALAKSPDDRYQNFQELSKDLTRYRRWHAAHVLAPTVPIPEEDTPRALPATVAAIHTKTVLTAVPDDDDTVDLRQHYADPDDTAAICADRPSDAQPAPYMAAITHAVARGRELAGEWWARIQSFRHKGTPC
jgi:serine/threonine-protein kinase